MFLDLTHTHIYNSTPSVHIPYLYYTYWINILHHYHNSADILIYIYTIMDIALLHYNGYIAITMDITTMEIYVYI